MSKKNIKIEANELKEIPEVDENSFSKDNLNDKTPKTNKKNKNDNKSNKNESLDNNINDKKTAYSKIAKNEETTNNEVLNKNLKLSINSVDVDNIFLNNKESDKNQKETFKIFDNSIERYILDKNCFQNLPDYIGNELKNLTQNSVNNKDNNNEIKDINDLYKEQNDFIRLTKVLIVILCVSIGLSFLITTIAIIFTYYLKLFVFYVIIASGSISFFISIFGVYQCYKNSKKIEKVINNKEDPELIAQSKERMNMYFFMFLIEFIFCILFVISISALLFDDKIKMEIRAIGYDMDLWKQTMGNLTYNKAIKIANVMLICLGFLSFLLGALYVTLFILLIRKLGNYRTYKLLYQFTFLLFFTLNMVLIYFSFKCMKLQDISRIEKAKRGWFASPLFGISIFFAVFSVIGWFSVLTENKKVLLIIMITAALSSITVFVMNIEGILLVKKLNGYKNADCRPIYKYIDENYLKQEFQCQKYWFTSSISDEIPCPKSKVIPAWELYEKELIAEKQTDMIYGCIRQQCCLDVYSYILDAFQYTILFTFTSFFMCIVIIVSGIILYKKIENTFDEGIRSFYIYTIMIIFTSLVVIMFIIVFSTKLPRAPAISYSVDKKSSSTGQLMTDKQYLISPSDKSTLNKKVLSIHSEKVIQSLIYTIININNTDLDLFVELSLTNGIINLNGSSNNYKIISKADDKVVLKGDQNMLYNLNNIIYLNKNDNEDILSSFEGQKEIYVMNKNDTNKPTETVNSNNINEDNKTIYIDSNNSMILIKEDFSIPLFNDSINLKLEGNFVNKLNKKITVDLSNDLISSEPLLSKELNENETTFTIEGIPYISNKVIIKYNVSFYYSDNDTYKYNTSFTVGGFFFDYILDKIENITIPENNMTYDKNDNNYKICTVKGQIRSSSSNGGIDGEVEIYLFSGNIPLYLGDNIDNILDKSARIYSSDDSGRYSIPLIFGIYYTIFFKKNEYYIEKLYFTAYSNSTIIYLPTVYLVKKKSEYPLSVQLTWKDYPKDLDLHSIFAYSGNLYCDVSFLDNDCLEVTYDSDNKYGGQYGAEKLNFKKFGKYKYLFYVHKYEDISNGHTSENIVDGVEYDRDPFYDLKDNIDYPLSKSEIKINIYHSNFNIKSFKIDMNNSEQSNYKYWIGFCIDGSIGISSLKIINTFSENKPSQFFCDDYYD